MQPRRLVVSDTSGGGRVQISIWMDDETAGRVKALAKEMNNTVSGTSGFLVRLGMAEYERRNAREGGESKTA